MSCDDQAKFAALEKEVAALELTLAEKDKTITEQDKTIAEQDKTIAERSLLALKADPFVFVDRTASEPHCASETHARSKLESRVVELQELSDEVWDAPYIRPVQKKEVTVDSEAMVVARVVEIIQALIVGLGFKELVHVATNRTVAGVELDIVLLFGSHRIPFAAIEVKKSGMAGYNTDIIFKGEDSSNDTFGFTTGQHLDQLNAIGLFGFQSVFGMITNGNKWMITSTTPFAEGWDLSKTLHTIESVSPNILPEQNLLYLSTASQEQNMSTVTEEEGSGGRRLIGSQTKKSRTLEPSVTVFCTDRKLLNYSLMARTET
jgi:hypothetical protein